ncbi:MAG: hypothetical protein E7425_13030 [Ruminococcaceae bacterium]|nr:hypothetical protein [Oscillospiraceae bacterium]
MCFQKRRDALRLLTLGGVLVLLMLSLSACSGSEPEPDPDPNPVIMPTDPVPTNPSKPFDNPYSTVDPMDYEPPITIDEALRQLGEDYPVLVPLGDNEYLYEDDASGITISATTPAEAQAEIESVRSDNGPGEDDDQPALVNGLSGNTPYTAVSSGNTIYVYVTVGGQTVRAEAPRTDEGNSRTGDANEIQKAASVAASVVTSARAEKPYENGRDDYNHNYDVYYMELAECLVYYPAQLTKKAAFEDQSVIFSDARSSATCSIRLERNPFVNADELDALIRETTGNHVLGWDRDWVASEFVQDGVVTFMHTGLGEKYMVTVELTYPEKYDFVFNELRDLIRCRFIEGGVWSGARVSQEYGAPTYGVREFYYPEHDCYLVLPDTMEGMDEREGELTFYDETHGCSAAVRFFGVDESVAGNLFGVFSVVAEDGNLTLEDDFVRWHNSYGMFVGALQGSQAAILEFYNDDAFTTYEGVYGEIMCRLFPHYEETPAPEETPAAAPDPVSAGTPPANKIDLAVQEKVTKKAQEDYPIPAQKNDPLIFYSDADRRAVNTSMASWGGLTPSAQVSLLSTIRKVLLYNGYTEAKDFDVTDLYRADVFDVISGIRLGGELGAGMDVFPTVCREMGIDPVPDYSGKTKTELPKPEWYEELKEQQGESFDEEQLDWTEIRERLDGGESVALPETGESGAGETGAGETGVEGFPDLGLTAEDVQDMLDLIRYYCENGDSMAGEAFGGPDLDPAHVGRIHRGIAGYYNGYDRDGMDTMENGKRIVVHENGVWEYLDPDTGARLDIGVLVPSVGETERMSGYWYTLTSDGELQEIFEFDTGTLTFSDYGLFEVDEFIR